MKELRFDTVVCGGGVAGIAAALAAARGGAKTCLLEKEYALGGLATLGLIVVYLPLDDGDGVQMSGGICEELLKLSCRFGPVKRLQDCWKNPDATLAHRAGVRYQAEYNPATLMITAEELLLSEGVTLFYDARATDIVLRDGRLEAVVVAGKEGPRPVYGRAFIDATGDADLCWMAGEDTVNDETNRRTAWHYLYDGRVLKLHGLSDPLYTEIPADSRLYGGISLEDISRHMIDGRRFLMKHLEKIRQDNPDAYPLLIPTFPGFRMTRRLAAEVEFSEDAHERVWFADAVGMIGNWKHPHLRYSIPYRAVKAARTENLFAAGRCCAAEKSGWDLTRVIPTCAVTGEAAGTAAVMLCTQGALPDTAALQARLRQNGVPLDPSLFDRRLP